MPPAAPAAVADAAPPKMVPGKKKLLLVVAVAALLILALAGAGALFLMNKRAAALAAEEADDAAEVARDTHKDDKRAPSFVALDMFTVNLADREAERYAQIGVTLEIEDPKVADQLKAYMPAVRNNILMTLAAKTSQELLDREGKVRLAAEIRREAARGLGLDIPDALAKPASGADSAAKKRPSRPEAQNPITRVHFSNFIIQ